VGSLRRVTAGIRFIRSKPILLGAISLDLFAVLLGGATALLPIYARDILLAVTSSQTKRQKDAVDENQVV